MPHTSDNVAHPTGARHRYTMRNKVLNPIIRLLLSGPLHPLLSRGVLLLTYTGARTGHPHTLPVQFAQVDQRLVVLVADSVHKVWWHSLRAPAPVRVTLAGRTIAATGYVVDDPGRAAPLIEAYVNRFPHAKGAVSGASVVCLDLAPV